MTQSIPPHGRGGSATPAERESAPRSFAALRHPDYRVYFIATAAAMMADNIEHVISYWVLFERFHAPWLGGVAVLTHWLPFLFFSVVSGGLADRYDNRRIIQAAMLLFMLASLGWALLFLTDTLQPWHAVVLLTVHGMAGVLWGPASQVLIHDIVGAAHLQSAVRLNASSRSLGTLMGPAVGGGLMLLFGPAVGLIVNVLIYLPLTLWMWKAPYGMRPAGSGRTARAGGLRASIVLLREASSDPRIIAMLALAGTVSFFVGNAFQAQMPEYAHDFHTESVDTSYSVLLAAGAAGAFIGGLILESRSWLRAEPRTAMVLAILWSMAIAAFALTGQYLVGVALMFVAGFLYLAFNSMAQTLVQVHAPPHLRGRLVGMFNMASNGLRAFSGITVGFLGSLIGIHWSLAGSALVLLAVTCVLLAFSMRSRRSRP